MTVETATFISQLNSSYPATSDNKSEGDNHLRLIKATIVNTFPNVSGVISANSHELDIFAVGGTVSGNLTVYGDISISGTTNAAMVINKTSSASTVAAGAAQYNTTHYAIDIGNGTAVKQVQSDLGYMFASNPGVKYLSATAFTGLSYTYQLQNLWLTWGDKEGQSWTDSAGFISVPLGDYEIDVNVGVEISASSAGEPQLQIARRSGTDLHTYYPHQRKTATTMTQGLHTVYHCRSYSGRLMIRTKLNGTDGRIKIQSATANTSVLVRRL